MGRKKKNVLNQSVVEPKVTTKEDFIEEPIVHVDMTEDILEEFNEPVNEPVNDKNEILNNIFDTERAKLKGTYEEDVEDEEDIEEEPQKKVKKNLSVAQQRMKLRHGMTPR